MRETTLLKALVAAGVGSRRRVADAIKAGQVLVNGAVIEDFRYPVDTDTDMVSVAGSPVSFGSTRMLCLLLNKPRGVVSTTRDERARITVLDILPSRYREPGLHPVGRLDRDSRGLLLLTNDGDLTYRLTHPRFGYDKEYWVVVRGRLRPEDIRGLRAGLELEDGHTGPAVVEEMRRDPPTYRVVIREGKKRQVRRMFAALGHRVDDLMRVRIGGVSLGALPEGEVRELSRDGTEALLAAGTRAARPRGSRLQRRD
jgi:23S rRNA pseudouridine2605 synthase